MSASILSPVRFPNASDPRASIVILAWRHLTPLVRCLESLQRHLPGGQAEVIVLLNGASRDVVDYIHRCVIGATVITSEVNRGFAGGCNRAAAFAHGDYLVLLNDDAEIEPGWLETLLETADRHPRAGAVGSRILFADGTLQEAGCAVWGDGVTSHVGRHDPSGSPAFMEFRIVDYCSGCSLLVRRSVWDSIGGLDEGYFPAYYEDADLCMAIRASGGVVIYEPRSRVRHLESTSIGGAFKHFVLERNRRRFVEKWKHHLTDRPTMACGRHPYVEIPSDAVQR